MPCTVPQPLVTEVRPVSFRLLNSEAPVLNEDLSYWTGLVEQTQTPGRQWPALDGVRGEKR